jgi:hypothetical protein
MREIRAEVRSAQARLDEVLRVCDAGTVSALPARLLRMDATCLVNLMDELQRVTERESVGMLISLRRVGDDFFKEVAR